MPRAAAPAIAERSAVSPAPPASISSSTALIAGWSPNQSFSSSGPVTPASAEQPEGRAVEPAVVGVATGEDHRDVSGDGVELGDRTDPVPRTRPVAESADQPGPFTGQSREVIGHPPRHVLRARRPGEVDGGAGPGPGRQVDVVVPQSRDRPPARGVDDVGGTVSRKVRTHLGDHPVGDPQVHRPVVDAGSTHTGSDRNQARPSDQHLVGRSGRVHGAESAGSVVAGLGGPLVQLLQGVSGRGDPEHEDADHAADEDRAGHPDGGEKGPARPLRLSNLLRHRQRPSRDPRERPLGVHLNQRVCAGEGHRLDLTDPACPL